MSEPVVALALVISPALAHAWCEIARASVVWYPLSHAPDSLDPAVQGCVVIPDRHRPLTAIQSWLPTLHVPVVIITTARHAARTVAEDLHHGCLICSPRRALIMLPDLIRLMGCQPWTGTLMLPDHPYEEETDHAPSITPARSAGTRRLVRTARRTQPGLYRQ